MKHAYRTVLPLLVLIAGAAVVLEGRVWQGAPAANEKVAALKQSLQQSQANLRKYEWIETTTVSLKGEEKSRKQQRCYYGADGKLEKLPLGDQPAAPAPEQQSRGRRGARVKQHVIENKKEEMQEYMKSAAALIHSYIPPKPADIEKAKEAGTIAVRPGEGGRARLEFTSYLKKGDSLAIDLDGAANRLTALNVASYLEEPGDSVTLVVNFGVLSDGTSYAQQTTLDAKAKQIRVVIENAGHRPMAP